MNEKANEFIGFVLDPVIGQLISSFYLGLGFMLSIVERVAVYLDAQKVEIEEMRKLVGPLFSKESFEEFLSQRVADIEAHVQKMQDDDVEKLRQQNANESQTLLSTTFSPPFGTICPYGCTALCSPKEYFEHLQIHMIHEHIIDSKNCPKNLAVVRESLF